MINLNDLIKAANGQLFGEAEAQIFSKFAFNAADASPSSLFVALRTSEGDSHHDVYEAVRSGAVGVLCQEPPEQALPGVTIIIVRDTMNALMAWARYVLGRSGVRVIAVAGAASRSVTAHALAAILSARYRVHKGLLDVDGPLALPMTVADLPPDAEYAVVKLAPTAAHQMRVMVETCRPSVVVITELDEVVPTAFDSHAQYLAEHVLLLRSLSPSDLVVLNFDHDQTRELASQTRARVRTIGIESFGADLTATNIVMDIERTSFDLRYDQQRESGQSCPVLGRQQLSAVLAALLVGVELGVDLREGLDALSQLEPLPGRMRVLDGRGGLVLIDDSHHATLASTLDALAWLAEMRSEGRKTALVLGDLDDLGANSAYVHRMIGTRAAAVVEYLVTLGSEAALASRSAVDQRMPQQHIRSCYTIRDAVDAVLSFNLAPSDVVLVTGGVSSRMERVVHKLLASAEDAALLVRQDGRAVPDTHRQEMRSAWKEVDLEALGRNVRVLRAALADSVTLMAVVKSDAYGHGAVQVARVALANGAGYLAVANISEALELRDAGITAPILVLTYLPPSAVRLAIAQDITATLYDTEIAQQYDRAAQACGGKLRVHVKVDTGMGRLGLLHKEAIGAFRLLHSMRHLDIEGVYTHFATADEDAHFAQHQLGNFKQVVRSLRAGGFNIRYYHAANSPATLLDPEMHFNLVRVGIAMYGLQASRLVNLPVGLQPVLSWKTTVLQVKRLPAGHSVGYGRTYITRSAETIAVLPVGYADGLRRSPYTWKEVLIRGKRAPLIGRVSMEKCTVSVSHIPEVSAGDEVVLLGRQGFDRITAEEVASWLGTINYEVVTTIQPRAGKRG
jgi:alanine racemase